MNKSTQKRIANTLILLLIAAALLWILSLFVHLGSVAYTDNAQVRQDIVTVNSRIQGFVKQVCVDEFQEVHKGDTLLIIEDAQYRLRVTEAEAALAVAMAGTNVQQRSVATTGNQQIVTKAMVEEARVRMENAASDYRRFQSLFEGDAVTLQQLEQKKTEYEALKARYESMEAQSRSAHLATQEQSERLTQQAAGVNVARTQLELARLNLSYTVVTAPCDGLTARRLVREGELMQPGSVVFNIVSSDRKWIVANFKERQIKHVRLGDKVRIKVDAVPDVDFSGVVESISDATGAQYSPVPTDNSAGNFVKVEGRIPVKIALVGCEDNPDAERLRSGMNAEVEVMD